MGSVPAPDVILKDAPDVQDPDASKSDIVMPKVEPGQDVYESHSDSSLEPETSTKSTLEKTSQDPPPVVKRKGGRKPVSRHLAAVIYGRHLTLTDIRHV